MNKIKAPYPLVIVEYHDATRPDADWSVAKDYRIPGDVTCLAVGFVIAETKIEIALGQTLSDLQGDVQVMGIYRIPKSAIRRTVKL